jgi:peptide deformylase
LRAVNEEIIVFDDALVQNAREMLMIMHASEGVGLAAPQVIFPILKTLF